MAIRKKAKAKKKATPKKAAPKEKRVHRIDLQMTSGTSYKFYNIYVEYKDGRYLVRSHWGRIGNAGSDRLVNTYSHKGHAINAAKRLAQSKRDKGYREVAISKKTGKPVSVAQKHKKASLIRFKGLELE